MEQKTFTRMWERLLHGDEIAGTCDEISRLWRYDFTTRKPGIAYVDDAGNPVTDLDLACALSALAERRAVINLPTYQRRRQQSVHSGEMLVSATNRHGRIVGLVSNANVFSFSLLIDDVNVMTADSVGAPRNFMIQDLDGTWHEGWSTIEFVSTEEEAKLDALADFDGKVHFSYFVHPLRWTSFYGRPYILAKVAIDRLTKEYGALRKALAAFPKAEIDPVSEPRGETVPLVVPAFNAKVVLDAQIPDVAPIDVTEANVQDMRSRSTRLNQLLRDLRFQTRATEFAFWKHAVSAKMERINDQLRWLAEGGPVAPRKAAWVASKEWEHIKESPRARTFWASMRIIPEAELRWRVWKRTEQVAAP